MWIQDRYRNHESLNLIQKHINTCRYYYNGIEKQTYRWVFRWFDIDLVAECISNYGRQIDKTIFMRNFIN